MTKVYPLDYLVSVQMPNRVFRDMRYLFASSYLPYLKLFSPFLPCWELKQYTCST